MFIREARATDLQKLIKVCVPTLVYGQVAVENDEIIGAGWVVYGREGKPWACFHSTPELREYPIGVTRALLRGIEETKKYLPEIFVMSEGKLAGWLGFKDTGREIEGLKVMIWQQHY